MDTASTTTAPARTPTDMHWHPMELLPYFRRWKRSVLRDIFYTFLWNNLFSFIVGCISLGFSDPGPMGRFLWVQFVMTQCVGFSIHGLFDLLGLLFNRWLSVASSAVRTVYYMVVPTAGIFVGYWIGFGLLNMHAARAYVFSARGAWGVTVFALIIAGLLCIAFITRDRQRQSEVTLANERQRTLDAERRALEAQLRMLQAQIEPHFLYNTLANAVGLIAPAPDKARLLLERLIDYLRASLTESREKEIRLGRELDTIRAYLDLMTVRMGDRLRYRIDCPAELSQQPMAPMLLQPLVENAIQHGLEPKIEGGEVMLTVQRDGSALRIDVVDTGTGFDPSARPRPGGGIGLSNLRERLATLYGGNAQLSLADNLGGGVKASLRLPIAG